MQTLWQDLRYALRQLRNAPGFALTAVLTLALGVGATIGVYTLVDAVLLRPLPYSDPGRLFELNEKDGLMVRSYLFGVSPHDAGTAAAASALLIATGLVAALIPARRASSIEPMHALRTE